jgi:hypothetical protein
VVLGALGLVSLAAQLRARSWKWWAIAALAGWSLVVIAAARWWLAGAQ